MPKNTLVVTMNGDSTNLEKAIRDTKKQITDFQKSGERIDDIKKSFEALTESTKPLRTRIGKIKKAMEEMAVKGLDTSEEGQELWRRMSEAAQEYDEMLKRIQNDTRKVSDESSKVSPIQSSDEGNGGMLSNVDLKGIGGDLLKKSGLDGVTPALGAIAGAINPVTVGITAVGGTMIAAGKATAEFETHLNSLQALTGLTDDEMKSINDGAIEMSKNFKSSASEIVDAMKLIGSQAPELLKDSDALMKVTEAANVLSEAAEIGVEDAAKAITGTMNQMGASASEATDIINTFAAASQQGSADVAYLNRAFEKSGTAASSAGMNYVELASAVEAIAPKFSSADVAGSQLASTLLKLSMSGNSDFMPSVVGMSKALENLANAEMDDVTMKNLVGESNITMLKSLIDARNEFDSYSQSLQGTNTAFEQMETNQKGFNGAITKMKSAWDAFLLTLGQSGVMQGLTDNLILIIDAINEIINVVSDVIKSFEEFGGEGVNAINPVKYQVELLIKVLKGIGEVVQVVVRLVAKAFNAIVDTVKFAKEGATYHWEQVKKSLMDIGFLRAIINAFNKVIDSAVSMCNAIKKYWNKLKEFLGMKVETNVEDKATHIDSNIKDNTTNTSTNTSTTSTEKSSKSKSSKTTTSKTEKIDYLVSVDDKTLDTAEKKLNAWQNKKKSIKIDDVEGLKECDEQIKKWENEVIKRKLIIEYGNEIFDNLDKLQSNLESLQNQKQELEFILDVNSVNAEEQINALNDRLEALKSKEIEITTIASTDELEAIRSEIKALEDKKVTIETNIKENKETQSKLSELEEIDSNKNDVDDIQSEIDSLNDKKILIDVNVDSDISQLKELEASLNALESKELEIMVNGSTEELDAIRNEITDLINQRNIIQLSVETDSSKLDELNKQIEQTKNDIIIETIKIGFKPEIEKGSKTDLENEIKKLEDIRKVLFQTKADPQLIKQLEDEIKELKKKLEEEDIRLGVKPEIEKGSKTDLENEIKKLEDVKKVLFQTKADPQLIKQLEDEIKELKKKLEEEDIRLGVKPEIEDGSLNEIRKRIKEKEEEISLALNTNISSESMKKLQKELEDYREEERQKMIEIGVTKNVATIEKKSESWERGSVEDKKQSLSNAQSMVKDIQENYKLGLIGKEEVESQIEEINAKLQELGLKPIEITFNDDGTVTTAIENLERYKEQMSTVGDITSSVGSTFGSLGNAIGGTTGEIMNFAGKSISAIGEIIPQIVTMITAKEAEATANAMSGASSLPFGLAIPAMISVAATVASLFASLPKFETGGIVGGSSFTGDKLLARVNSGEMVLNKKQQKNLYNQLDNAGVGQATNTNVNVSGQFKVSGSDLKAVIRNYDNKVNRIR